MNQNVFNDSGSVTDLFETLRDKSILRFKSIHEIIDYKRNYHSEIESIKNKKTIEIIEEIENLNNESKTLQDEYNKQKIEQHTLILDQIGELNSILKSTHNNLFSKIRKYFTKKKLTYLESSINKIVKEAIKKYSDKIKECEGRIVYLTNNQNDEIHQRSKPLIEEVEYTVTELDNLAPLIYGSIGEIKAINVMQRLPDQYYIINDFRKSFYPPLFNRRENDKIFSIQLDHIVIGPTGIYVIETKYWSQKSIENRDLFSPIKQLKRGSFALFVILNNIIREEEPAVFSNNWGETKLSVSNILLMMNSTTSEQFQFVKILTESNFINYIIKRPIVLNDRQIKFLVNRIT
ncbi:NERD domain-containing protein [Brucepastera parasyntrophica]|uniref:nuclease-related domain-containing protein n=1 Tax=Brucepastera parasyntrophica TaxID=2880008 RepID=UPI002108A4CE|nr:nuclease-related domain-containing protein [Brucepastera parasyntrophica]ULQ61024.1 NERD domain-containing protein [Brucepastera parasyntrophica]